MAGELWSFRLTIRPTRSKLRATQPLLWVIRDEIGMTGTNYTCNGDYGCGLAQCVACSVLIDGVVARSCVILIAGIYGRKITTIEAIEQDDVGQRVVASWGKHQVAQCGYCQSGKVIATPQSLGNALIPRSG